jgi:hypothetical protein
LGLSEQRMAKVCPRSCPGLAVGGGALPVVHRSWSLVASDGQLAVE